MSCAHTRIVNQSGAGPVRLRHYRRHVWVGQYSRIAMRRKRSSWPLKGLTFLIGG